MDKRITIIQQLAEKLKIELIKPLPGFEIQKQMVPPSRMDLPLEAPDDVKNGAVLILIYEKLCVPMICFIKRAIDGGVHSGQISFPGGKVESTDKDLIFTALRESEEEIGIEPSTVKVLGILSPLYIPVSNYSVLPVVGYTLNEPFFKINDSEVDSVIEVSLNQLLNPETATTGKIQLKNTTIPAPYFKIEEHKIWGATAMILNEFLYIMRQSGINKIETRL